MFLSHVVAKALAHSHWLYMKAVICKMIVFTEMGFVDETGNGYSHKNERSPLICSIAHDILELF